MAVESPRAGHGIEDTAAACDAAACELDAAAAANVDWLMAEFLIRDIPMSSKELRGS